jgi:hypothetical protein
MFVARVLIVGMIPAPAALFDAIGNQGRHNSAGRKPQGSENENGVRCHLFNV